MIPTLTLLLLPALQEPAPAPTPAPPAPPVAQEPGGRPGKGYKDLSDAEYYRGLQILQQEAARRGDTELATLLGARLASMDTPQGGRDRDRQHSRGRAKDTRSDKRGRGRDAGAEAGRPGKDGSGRFEKGRRRDRLEGKQSKEAQIEALQREIDRLEKELRLRQEQLAKVQSQPDTGVQQTGTPPGGRRGARPRGGR